MGVDMTAELDSEIGRLIEEHQEADGVVYLGPNGGTRTGVGRCVEDALTEWLEEHPGEGDRRQHARALLDRYIADYRPLIRRGERVYSPTALLDLGGGEYIREANACIRHMQRRGVTLRQEHERRTLRFERDMLEAVLVESVGQEAVDALLERSGEEEE